MLTYFNTEGTILEYTNNTNKKVVNYAQPLDISLTKTEDDSCICSGTKTLNLTATLNTTGQTNIYYQWYYNSVLLTGYTASAITYDTQPNSNIYCKIYSKLGEGNSNIITTAACPSQLITKTIIDSTIRYSSRGGLNGLFDYYKTGLGWVHDGQSGSFKDFTNITSITKIRFYFYEGYGYCGRLKTSATDPSDHNNGMLYVERNP